MYTLARVTRTSSVNLAYMKGDRSPVRVPVEEEEESGETCLTTHVSSMENTCKRPLWQCEAAGEMLEDGDDRLPPSVVL